MEGVKEARLKELFTSLDYDKDGLISGEKIDLSQLSSGVLDALTHFLVRLEQCKKQISYEEFKEEIEKDDKVSINKVFLFVSTLLEFDPLEQARTVRTQT